MSVMRQREINIRIDQSYTLKFLDDIRKLGLVAFQELATGRNIEEEVLHHKVGTCGTIIKLLSYDTPPLNSQTGAQFGLRGTGAQGYLRYGSDTGQGLATKAHSGETEKVCGLGYLARRMTFKGQAGIGLRHTPTIVNDLYARTSGIHYHNLDTARSSINSILQQFFYHRGGTLNDLASCNLVGHGIG